MSTAHTPGPWKAVHENVTAAIECFEIASVSHFRVITEQGGWPTHQGAPEDDARLIAAAPDLLIALSRLIQHANYMLSCSHDETAECDVQRARAAIVKATGSAA